MPDLQGESVISASLSLEAQLVAWNDADKADATCAAALVLCQQGIDRPGVHESVKDMCRDTYNFISKNKEAYVARRIAKVNAKIAIRDEQVAREAALIAKCDGAVIVK